MRRALPIAAVVLAIVIDGFFAVVNFYPVAPKPHRGPRRVVLLSLDPTQARWLRDNLVAEFDQEQNADVELVTTEEEQLLPALAAPAASSGALMLAAIPRARGAEALAAHEVRSFEEVAGAGDLAADLAGVDARAMQAARVDGRQVFLPRLERVDVMVFRLSRVRDAVRHWALLRPQIDAALKARNGRGLPEGYALELEPAAWDSYDRFVIAYYWAHRRYAGQRARGRVAHRAGQHLDAISQTAETLYRAGADATTLAAIDSPPTRDWLAWERLYRDEGLFAPESLAKRHVDDAAILDLLRRGEIYLATIDQMDAFALHGGSHAGAPPGVEDPDDLGFAPLPRFTSLELDDQGRPRRVGRAFTFREDWVWALPANGPDARLAYALVRFLWARENHARECEALGTLPLRDDVRGQRSSLFRLIWMEDVFDAAFALWPRSEPVPDTVEAGLGGVYAQLWDGYVRQGQGALDALLRAPPAWARRPHLPRPIVFRDPDSAPPDAGDEDPIDRVDNQLWHGKVELELGEEAAP